MNHKTIQLNKYHYVVHPKISNTARDVKNIILDLAKLREMVSKKWQGAQDAVQEIREQRGGTL